MNPNLSDHLKNTTVIPMNFDNGVPPRKKGSAFTVCPVILESQNEKTMPINLKSDEVPKKKISIYTIYPQSIDEQQTICSTYPHHVHFEDKVIVFVPQLDSESESDERIIEKTKSTKMWRCSLTIAAPIIIFLACFLIFLLAVLLHHN